MLDSVAEKTELLGFLLDGVMEWMPATNDIRYSDRWKAQLGYDPNELEDSPDTWMALSHPDDLPRLRELLADFLGTLWPFSHSWRMRHQTGQWRWMHCRMTAVRDSYGQAIRVMGTFTDVTERVIAEQRQAALVSAIPDLILRVRKNGRVIDAKPAEGAHDFGVLPPKAGTALDAWLPKPKAEQLLEIIRDAQPGDAAAICELPFSDGKQEPKLVEVRIVGEGAEEAVLILRDISDARRLATQQLQRQKLEAIGQLAAGIAHEINTPVQYVSDSVQFLSECYEQVHALFVKYREILAARAEMPGNEQLAEEMRQAEEDADLEYLQANAPAAFGRAIDGLGRITGIVRAMREFAHPAQREKQRADLNRALTTALTIARNEYKYIATTETDFGRIPPVMCHIGDMNQVFLNLIINAAHAIADVVRNSGTLGVIRVRTSRLGDDVLIEISDTGTGIPVSVRDRVFDPFFTTKEVGRGTGQGLAIARSIVVEKHGGSISFDTKEGEGTTFRILVPIDDSSRGDASRRDVGGGVHRSGVARGPSPRDSVGAPANSRKS